MSPNSQSPSSSQGFDCNSEAIKYIAGYLAFKFRLQFPALGEKTNSLTEHQKQSCPWIAALSRGGLTVPSPKFVAAVCELEAFFNEVHGSAISRASSVIRATAEQAILKFPSIPPDIIRAFIKTRTFIRIRYLNHQLRFSDESAKRRNERKLLHFKT